MAVTWEYWIEEQRLSDKWGSKRQAEEIARFREFFAAAGANGWELVSYQAVPMTGSINTSSINAYV